MVFEAVGALFTVGFEAGGGLGADTYSITDSGILSVLTVERFMEGMYLIPFSTFLPTLAAVPTTSWLQVYQRWIYNEFWMAIPNTARVHCRSPPASQSVQV